MIFYYTLDVLFFFNQLSTLPTCSVQPHLLEVLRPLGWTMCALRHCPVCTSALHSTLNVPCALHETFGGLQVSCLLPYQAIWVMLSSLPALSLHGWSC